MVDTALPSGREIAGASYRIERLTDREGIRELLAPEGAYAAYALAQLSPSLFPRTEWWLSNGATTSALILHSRGGLGQAILTMGDPAALDAGICLHPGPRSCFASFRPEHMEVMRRHFFLSRRQLMVRMVTAREDFQPVEGEAVQLGGGDVARINRLYSAEGGPAAYSSRHIEDGVYYGVIVAGELASVAGTHVHSPTEKVAVVGNVFTHPRYRGGGLATIATAAVTKALLEHCDLVALTVEVSNTPALAIYRKLGYRQESKLYETPAVRKDALGMASGLRRLMARWRGRREGIEIAQR